MTFGVNIHSPRDVGCMKGLKGREAHLHYSCIFLVNCAWLFISLNKFLQCFVAEGYVFFSVCLIDVVTLLVLYISENSSFLVTLLLIPLFNHPGLSVA